VSLGGVSSAQFDSTAKTAFQQAIASKDYGSITVDSSQVVITDPSRRDLTVSFTVYTGSSDVVEVAKASASMLSFLKDTSSSGFAQALNTAASHLGSTLSTTGVTVIVEPTIVTTAPTPTPTVSGEIVLQRQVALAGVSSSEFDSLAEVAFKEAIADHTFPSLSSLSVADIEIISVSSTSRRTDTTYVTFHVYTGSTDSDAVNTAGDALNAYLTSTSSSGFARNFNTLCSQFGLSISTTGVMIVSSNTSAAASSGLSAGAVAGIVIAAIVVLVILCLLVYFCFLRPRHNPTDGTRVVKNSHGDERLTATVPTMGSSGDAVLSDKTVQI